MFLGEHLLNLSNHVFSSRGNLLLKWCYLVLHFLHMSTLDCQVPSINNNWNNPNLWMSVFRVQCFWPVVKFLPWLFGNPGKNHAQSGTWFCWGIDQDKDVNVCATIGFLSQIYTCTLSLMINLAKIFKKILWGFSSFFHK